MNGLLVMDKPAGITSHDVVTRVRRVLTTRSVGHTGTLDPFATGLMILLVGKATKLARFLDKDEKQYEAVVRFGTETDTGDRTGTPTRSVPREVSREEITAVMPQFTGEIQQVPPMFSAKKIAGKRLYESARRGIHVERKPVSVTIHELDIIDDALDKRQELTIRVVCSAGTYIRTLAEDIGRAAGSACHLAELRRTRSGPFGIESAITLEQFQTSSDPAANLLPARSAVEQLAEFSLPADRVGPTRNGLSTRGFDGKLDDGQFVQMIAPDEELVAIGVYDAAEGVIQPKIVLV